MLKVNYYNLFYFAVLFFNSANVLCSSYSQPNNQGLRPVVSPLNTNFTNNVLISSAHTQEQVTNAQSEQSLFFSLHQHPTNAATICPLFPMSSSITPQSYNPYFNSSTDTFIPPFALSGWDPNNSTAIFNINNISPFIANEGRHFNNASPLFIPDASIPSNTADTTADANKNLSPAVVLPINKNKEHALVEKKKHTTTYSCPTCKKCLGSLKAFKYHVKTHDPNRTRPYQCHLCNKSFAEKHILKNHISRHSKEKPFKCDFCNKCFKAKYEKTRHYRIHTGEKPFKCDICQKGLSSKIALEEHLNKHKGKKTYTCEECRKSFCYKSNLREHRKLHKDKKPYKCRRCTKAYTTKNGLQYHIKTHNKPKPYICHYCGASFTSKAKHKNHIHYEDATDEDRKCHICKKVFVNKYYLAKHTKKEHPKT